MSETGRRVRTLSHLPPYYEGVRVFAALTDAYDGEFARTGEDLERYLEDAFVQTAGEEGLERRERELGIAAHAGESLAFRRQRLLARYAFRPPMTLRYLKKQLSHLLEGEFSLERGDSCNSVVLRADVASWPVLREVQKLLEEYVPLSMTYQIVVTAGSKPAARLHHATGAALALCLTTGTASDLPAYK